MDEINWRYGVVANIAEYHIGKDGQKYHGTKPFAPGTKVYVGGKYWSNTLDEIGVIGPNRFGRITLEWIPSNSLENVRPQRIYRPEILNIIFRQEVIEGWEWWKRTSSDRKETIEFVNNWKNKPN